jgi:hypothetical protein
VAVILMLASQRPANALWWIAGWALSTFATGLVVVLVIGEVDVSGQRAHSTTACVVQLVLSVLLALAAARIWSRRPAQTGAPPGEPRWMARVGAMRPLVAFALGAFWINVALVVAAAVDTLRADLGTSESVAVCALFAVASSSVQLALVAYARLRPMAAAARLQDLRMWVTGHQQPVMAGVALVLAIWFGAQGLTGLAG